MSPAPCTPSCGTTVQTTNTPGTSGQSAVTTTTAAFTIPAVGSSVAVSVGDTSWMVSGQNVFIYGANFEVGAINSAISLTLKTVGINNDTAAGTSVPSGSVVAPGLGNYLVPVSLSTTNQFTDNTTGAASDTLAAGVGVVTVPLYVNLADIANADLLTTYTPGYAFKILAVSFGVEKAATTASKAATITPKINGSAITGGVLSLTSANATPQGTVIAGTSVTGSNTGTGSGTISVTGSGVTTFAEGAGWILLRIQNMDTANAVASLASKINAILTAL